jgi:hypothetical protein
VAPELDEWHWELDQPHYLHAHGRSPHGHAPHRGQVEAFTAVREQITRAARYEDDKPRHGGR